MIFKVSLYSSIKRILIIYEYYRVFFKYNQYPRIIQLLIFIQLFINLKIIRGIQTKSFIYYFLGYSITEIVILF
jgi:hypothetical protein